MPLGPTDFAILLVAVCILTFLVGFAVGRVRRRRRRRL